MLHKVSSDYNAKVFFEGIGEVERRLQVTPEIAEWDYLYFRSYTYRAGLHLHGESAGEEMVMVLLSGKVSMTVAGTTWMLDGRDTVFSGRPYTIYLPPGYEYQMEVIADCDCAYSRASATGKFKPRMISPEEVKVEKRQTAAGEIQVCHILDPGDAEKLLCLEATFPGGTWMDYPAHRHLATDGKQFNSVQYYRFDSPAGWALQRLCAKDNSYDEAIVVNEGDAVMIRDSYHPVIAAPTGRAYYLNFLATENPTWATKISSNL